MFQSALICTDFTDGLHRFVRFVPSLAASGLKKIVFLHTAPLADGAVPRPNEEKEKQARDRLSPALQNIPSGLEVKVDVRSGNPPEHILNAIRTHNPELLILGTAGRSLLNEKLFGSTTINLCQRVAIPCMILRPQLISTYTEEELDLRCRHLFRYFLLPYDNSESAQYTLQRIREKTSGKQTALECCLLAWIVDEVSRNADLRKNAINNAEKVLASVKTSLDPGLRVETEVCLGNAVTEILDLAVERDITAIVSGSRNVGKLIELSVPSLTGELLRKSWHPIIYFPIR
ncbi:MULTISPECIES: universal stress protein [unclassified Leptolyngbya]|uniref:universal stress protein n=1 Tax=unclassified Leptolyngbya TaxID=2650499 RepID=UPI0016870BF8|nr:MULTISPECIES: universal stress protein [unclassified Leptolyngbya]MBD1910951.1 universal stress protein [Leptolyngbya sp. FACHB-8]MBD2158383.1 universal stress protein [Leptolyngbya sp. FACHB-16]